MKKKEARDKKEGRTAHAACMFIISLSFAAARRPLSERTESGESLAALKRRLRT